MSLADIFAALGGNSNVARLLGVGASAISEMKRRGRIPAEYWRDLVAAAQQRERPEITFELLATLHARTPESREVRGFSEDSETADFGATEADGTKSTQSPSNTGHFSRWRHLRRPHFASMEEINAHVRALRDEWDRR